MRRCNLIILAVLAAHLHVYAMHFRLDGKQKSEAELEMMRDATMIGLRPEKDLKIDDDINLLTDFSQDEPAEAVVSKTLHRNSEKPKLAQTSVQERQRSEQHAGESVELDSTLDSLEGSQVRQK